MWGLNRSLISAAARAKGRDPGEILITVINFNVPSAMVFYCLSPFLPSLSLFPAVSLSLSRDTALPRAETFAEIR